jgi:hypothetical protein
MDWLPKERLVAERLTADVVPGPEKLTVWELPPPQEREKKAMTAHAVTRAVVFWRWDGNTCVFIRHNSQARD